MLCTFPRQFGALHNGQYQCDLYYFARYEGKRASVNCSGPSQSYSKCEPCASARENDRFAGNESASQPNGMKTRKTACGNMLNEPARHKRSRWICEQIASRGPREPERPGHAKRLKNGKACHALEQVENARQHSSLRTKQDGDKKHAKRLTGDRNRGERQRALRCERKAQAGYLLQRSGARQGQRLRHEGSDPRSVSRDLMTEKLPTPPATFAILAIISGCSCSRRDWHYT